MPRKPLSSGQKSKASVPSVCKTLTATDFTRRLAKLSGISKNTPAHFALAVSGGADSLALLALAAKVNNPNWRFSVLTVNHGLRAAAAKETRYVAKLARTHGLGVKTLDWQGAPPTRDIQATAREIRYRLMTDWCQQNSCTALVVAHHLEDQAETFLLRLARGSGLDGLTAMQSRSLHYGVTLLRPFLDIPRARLHATTQKAGFVPVDDPSNHDDRFARVRMRQVMDTLAAEGLSPARLSETAARLQTARTALDEVTAQATADLVTNDAYGTVYVDRTAFKKLPVEVLRRLMARLLTSQSAYPPAYPPRAERLAAVLADIKANRLKGRTLNGFLLRLRHSQLVICREPQAAAGHHARLAPGERCFWDGRFDVKWSKKAGFSVNLSALGKDGVQNLRDRGIVLPKQVPAATLASLPAFRRGKQIYAAALVLPRDGAKFSLCPVPNCRSAK